MLDLRAVWLMLLILSMPLLAYSKARFDINTEFPEKIIRYGDRFSICDGINCSPLTVPKGLGEVFSITQTRIIPRSNGKLSFIVSSSLGYSLCAVPRTSNIAFCEYLGLQFVPALRISYSERFDNPDRARDITGEIVFRFASNEFKKGKSDKLFADLFLQRLQRATVLLLGRLPQSVDSTSTVSRSLTTTDTPDDVIKMERIVVTGSSANEGDPLSDYYFDFFGYFSPPPNDVDMGMSIAANNTKYLQWCTTRYTEARNSCYNYSNSRARSICQLAAGAAYLYCTTVTCSD